MSEKQERQAAVVRPREAEEFGWDPEGHGTAEACIWKEALGAARKEDLWRLL